MRVFGVFPLHHRRCSGVVSPRIAFLFGRKIIFEAFQPTVCALTVPKSYGQTDRRADGRKPSDRQTTYCGITALCVASRGKKGASEVCLEVKGHSGLR